MWHWFYLTHRMPHWVHVMHPMPHWGACPGPSDGRDLGQGWMRGEVPGKLARGVAVEVRQGDVCEQQQRVHSRPKIRLQHRIKQAIDRAGLRCRDGQDDEFHDDRWRDEERGAP